MNIIDFKAHKERRQVLTLKLLKDTPNSWEAVLAYPLPPKPSEELLAEALHSILDCIHFNAHSPNDEPEEHVRRILQPVFDKIVEIALLRK